MLSKLLIKRFIPNNTNAPSARAKGAALSSITGIICNVLLFLIKFAAGTMTGSVSIVSDAFNNLSDCASCIVALLGGVLASKPADKDHPFGHGRIEYLAAMVIAALIMLVGAELFSDSAYKILSPAEMEFSIPALTILLCSIGVKLWMSLFNMKLGKMFDSSVILATAKDSRNDIIATSAAAFALIATPYTSVPVDGIAGVLVSIFILKCGFDIIRETVDDLLGKPADEETTAKIRKLILAHKKVLDVHDLVIHNYGPSHMMGSCHVEVDSNESFCTVHSLVDHIEKRIMEETGITMTIHMDPANADTDSAMECKNFILAAVSEIDEKLTIHDFALDEHCGKGEVSFDLVINPDCKYKNEQLRSMIATELNKYNDNLSLRITFDIGMSR